MSGRHGSLLGVALLAAAVGFVSRVRAEFSVRWPGNGGLGSAAPGCGQLLSQQPHPPAARVVLASSITLCLQPWGEGQDNGPLGPPCSSAPSFSDA